LLDNSFVDNATIDSDNVSRQQMMQGLDRHGLRGIKRPENSMAGYDGL
jgi:hypothetical protein